MKTRTSQKALSERRRHVRARRVLTIRHRLYKHKGVVVNGAWRFSTTADMSLIGILFNSDISYAQGDVLEAHITMSGLDVFHGFARVVRTQTKSKTLSRIAIVFMDEKSKHLRFAA